MSVTEKINENSDKENERKIETSDFLFPQILDYWNGFLLSAKQNGWGRWRLPAKFFPEGEDEVVDVVNNLEEVCDNPLVEKFRRRLISSVGEIIYIGEWLQVDQNRISSFAHITEDNQWIHTDPVRAKRDSAYRTTIAHGFLTLSLLPKLTGISDSDEKSLPAGCQMVVNLGLNQVRFPAPLKCNTRVRAVKKVVNVDIVKRGLIVEEEIRVEIDGSSRPACIAHPIYRYVFS